MDLCCFYQSVSTNQEEQVAAHSTSSAQSYSSMNSVGQPSVDFGSTNLKEAFPEQSASTLEDEVCCFVFILYYMGLQSSKFAASLIIVL